MSPKLQPGLQFEWQTTVPEHSVVPHLFGSQTPFARDMPAVMATGYMVGLMELACTQAIMDYVDWRYPSASATKIYQYPTTSQSFLER